MIFDKIVIEVINMQKYLKLIRINHWIKNILIFLPLFFSGNIFNISLLLTSILAFFIFSLTSSIVYIINDINDIEKDRLHAIKKNRPLASGIISKKQAIYIIFMLIILVIIGITYLYIKIKYLGVIIVPTLYLIINILYSKFLKNIAIIDVLLLVSGFVLRVLFGGIVVNITLSKYLYLMIIFGSYYLSFGKRRSEIKKNGDKSRIVLARYNESFLEKNMYVAYALSVVAYTLWCVDPAIANNLGHDYMFFTIPILMTILQLYSLNIEKDSYGDPVDIILSDKPLLIIGIFYIIIMTVLIYLI